MSVSQFPVASTLTPKQALASSTKQANQLKKVIVVAEYEDGDLFIQSSRMSHAEALWLVKRAETHIFK